MPVGCILCNPGWEKTRFLLLPTMLQTVPEGGPSSQRCSSSPVLPSQVHREMNFNYKAPSYRQHTAPL